jgi:hypothetical protein
MREEGGVGEGCDMSGFRLSCCSAQVEAWSLL